MFLEYFYAPLRIIECVFGFIEDHSILVGIAVSVITSSLWLKKFLKQKRAEAFFDFYAKLSLRLSILQTLLEENGQLNTEDNSAGNIYSLLYADNIVKTICPQYMTPNDLGLYQKAAEEIKKLLLETDNNVYPPGSDRKKWYESQQTLISFCEFLEDERYRKRIGKSKDDNGECKHIIKCKALVNALHYIQEAINNAKY